MTSIQKRVKIKFEGRNETLKIIDSGGELVKHLVGENSLCPLIGSEIKFVKKLGEGEFGAVFSVKIQGMNEKEYVAKRVEAETELAYIKESGTLREIAQGLHKKFFIIEEEFIKLNGGNPNKYIDALSLIILPMYSTMCRTRETKFIVREKDGKKITIPRGSYLCPNETYSEYVIGILAGNFYRQQKSINFIDVFNFTNCSDITQVSQYIFMEKINNTLFDILECLNESFTSSALIQTLHSLALLQTHKIMHNDLHLRNVFVEYITKDTKFNDQTLYDADYFHYVINGIDLYVPMTPFLIKLGDFGLSFKWEPPIVGNRGIIEGEFKGIIPNWYSSKYDSQYFIMQLFKDSKFKYKFLTKLCSWTLQGKKALKSTYMENIEYIALNRLNYIEEDYERPLLNLVDSFHSNPTELLTNKELMKDFLEKPKGKIVTLGKL